MRKWEKIVQEWYDEELNFNPDEQVRRGYRVSNEQIKNEERGRLEAIAAMPIDRRADEVVCLLNEDPWTGTGILLQQHGLLGYQLLCDATVYHAIHYPDTEMFTVLVDSLYRISSSYGLDDGMKTLPELGYEIENARAAKNGTNITREDLIEIVTKVGEDYPLVYGKEKKEEDDALETSLVEVPQQETNGRDEQRTLSDRLFSLVPAGTLATVLSLCAYTAWNEFLGPFLGPFLDPLSPLPDTVADEVRQWEDPNNSCDSTHNPYGEKRIHACDSDVCVVLVTESSKYENPTYSLRIMDNPSWDNPSWHGNFSPYYVSQKRLLEAELLLEADQHSPLYPVGIFDRHHDNDRYAVAVQRTERADLVHVVNIDRDERPHETYTLPRRTIRMSC